MEKSGKKKDEQKTEGLIFFLLVLESKKCLRRLSIVLICRRETVNTVNLPRLDPIGAVYCPPES